jgi:hypothetical protein
MVPAYVSQRGGELNRAIARIDLAQLSKVARNTGCHAGTSWQSVRLGGHCLALLIVVWGFLIWSAGNGGPLYFGVLAAVVVFLIGQALRYVLAGKPSDRQF